ncbi:unnamed protein product (mitochondrion) [Plasmodiophora brassicae]|uniref:Uncharacterized protein n=1 Tax=Plasmodiophora brassicae TaxID=37360 RepID=A0A0G4J3F6_PLABS|nr:hypothetical protein PBRA_002393 [Plasmodiophora brassicae]SPQ93681.1 unnamed protein product [Plasmodiophora brassicae]
MKGGDRVSACVIRDVVPRPAKLLNGREAGTFPRSCPTPFSSRPGQWCNVPLAMLAPEEDQKLESQVSEKDHRKVFGNRMLAETSEAAYYVHYRGLNDRAPKYAPSMLARTIVHYMDWKTGEEGSALCDVKDNDVEQ